MLGSTRLLFENLNQIRKQNTMFYLLFYVVGIVVAMLSSPDSTKTALEIISPITLTALFASLLVPFAGFDRNTEKWQKFALKYGLVPLFGVYTVVLWQKFSVSGMLLLVAASGVHWGYWQSSIHSRAYRLEQFRLGFAARMPGFAQLIAMLNGQGRSSEADEIVTRILSGKELDQEKIKNILREFDNSGLLMMVPAELSRIVVESNALKGSG